MTRRLLLAACLLAAAPAGAPADLEEESERDEEEAEEDQLGDQEAVVRLGEQLALGAVGGDQVHERRRGRKAGDEEERAEQRAVPRPNAGPVDLARLLARAVCYSQGSSTFAR